MPPNAQHITVLRVVIREDFSRTLAERLVIDIEKVIRDLDELPSRVVHKILLGEEKSEANGDNLVTLQSDMERQREIINGRKKLVSNRKKTNIVVSHRLRTVSVVSTSSPPLSLRHLSPLVHWFSWQEQFWCRYPDDFLDIAKNRSSYGTRSLVYSWITLCSTFAKLDTHFTSTFSTIQTHGQKGHLISSSLVLKSED
ncbi:Uncharacterized protein Rs2_05236 [Raphanus sativus]|nr:Uncharacterized protein Rs2_05236 [Raphanus sativus]